ncbi:hypothetical protein ACFE04_023258 [Oxalis oulophora]
MEAATGTASSLVQSSFGPLKYSKSFKSGSVHGPDFVRFNSKFQHKFSSASSKVVGHRAFQKRHCLAVKVSASAQDLTGSTIAPLQMESPIGQFLSEILASHPHLVHSAVEEQLDQLQTEREAETQVLEPSSPDQVLYRRIAQVKDNDRKKALEEILYTLVVQKFMDADVPLSPVINSSGPGDTCASQDGGELKNLHSPDAYEMIQNHVALILGNRLNDTTSVAKISKLKVGQVYAASLMYGYFLKRADQRFQLEKTMNLLPNGSDEEICNKIQHSLIGGMMRSNGGDETMTSSQPEATATSVGISPRGFHPGMKASRLRSYVLSFEGETLQRYTSIRSKEAVSLIEKHTKALFARPDMIIAPNDNIDSVKDELIKISFGGLKRLVFEAVTFGSFLWEVESHVDSRYQFVMN